MLLPQAFVFTVRFFLFRNKQKALQGTNQALEASEEERQQVLDALKIPEEEKLRKEAELATRAMERAELKQQIAESELEAARNEMALQQECYMRNLGFAVAGALLLILVTGWQRYRYIRQKKLSAIEKQCARRLEEIDQLKDQFLANTSHELRTPLNGIIGDDERMDAAAISNTVNTTTRIESLNKYYGSNILLSEESYLAAESRNSCHFRYLGQVQVTVAYFGNIFNQKQFLNSVL